MKQNLFLEKNRSEFSNNVERTINVGLSTKTRLLPNDNILDEFSLFEKTLYSYDYNIIDIRFSNKQIWQL